MNLLWLVAGWRLGDVPADAQLDDFRIEAAPAVHGISGNGPGHLGISSELVHSGRFEFASRLNAGAVYAIAETFSAKILKPRWKRTTRALVPTSA